jgi:uncharacterized RDD family membrane protein YckC
VPAVAVTCPRCGFGNLLGDRECARCKHRLVELDSDDAPAPAPRPDYVSAGYWPRAVARLIDLAAVQTVGPMCGGILLALLGFDRWTRLEQIDLNQFSVQIVLAIFFVLTYHAVAESFGGATLGKLLLGLRVVAEHRGPITLGQAVVRNLWFYVDLPFGAPAMRRSPRRQRLGDRRARTLVLRRRDVPADLRPGALRMASGIVAAFALVGVEIALLVTLLLPPGSDLPTA